ncbi:MAG: DUF5777 family beta-barrel protein [Pyrinomonadaceae bacterium]
MRFTITTAAQAGRQTASILCLLLALTCLPTGYAFAQTVTSGTPAAPAGDRIATVDAGPVRFSFDEQDRGVVYVEAGGVKFRVDPASRTVQTVMTSPDERAAASAAAPAAGSETKPDKLPAASAERQNAGEGAYDFDKGEEPYDYRLVNIPTPKSVPKGTWNLTFTHRFTQPVHPVETSARNLFGLDSFGIASFGLTYGVTDRLWVSASRSPLCQRGLCRVIELGAGYNFLTQDADSPIALSAYASIEGNGNFTEEYTYNLQARASARLGKRVYLFFDPAVHINSNGQGRFDPRPEQFFPPAPVANTFRQPAHTASFGFGASVLITPDLVALVDFTPRVGFKLGRVLPIFDQNFRVTGFRTVSHPTLGLGLQKNIGKHSFAITFSNTQTTTTSRYNSSNLVLKPRRLVIGFNLSRRF